MPSANAAERLRADLWFTLLSSLVSGLLSALLLALLVLIAAPAMAAAEPPEEAPGPAGNLWICTISGAGPVLAPRLDTEVELQVSPMLVRARVAQRFRNLETDWVEGTYVFPLPEDASVDRLRLRVGERLIEGEIQERQAARKTYQQAKKQGHRTGLVEAERPNVFTTSMANIGPGEEVSVEIEYQQTLSYDNGEFHLRFPMVVGPRYIPGRPLAETPVSRFDSSGWARPTDQVPDAPRITPPVADPADGPLNPLRLRVHLSAGFALHRLESRYHQIRVQEAPGFRFDVELAAGPVPADRDFELVWAPAVAERPRAALFTEHWEGADYALLMLLPQAPGADGLVPARELVFVVDTSGSMHGASITQAKAALADALHRLRPGDRFNLIQFNNRTQSLFPAPVAADAGNLQQALAYVRALRADGGTEMLPAIHRALQGTTNTGLLRQLVFLTDGSVGNEDALFAAIQAGLGDSRLFTVGIGSAPNSHFMRRAAGFGRGSFTYIGKTEEVAKRMTTLFRKLETTALSDLRLEWLDGAEAAEVWPQRIPDLYLGEPLVLALRMPRLQGGLRVEGRFGDQPWEQTLTLAGGAAHPGVHGLWARRKLDALVDQPGGERSPEELRRELVATALEHRLVTRHTSLVAVDKTPARPAQAPLQTRPLPVNLPAGWDGAKVFGSMPKTGTGSPLALLLGVLCLLVAALLRPRPARRPA